VSSAAKGVIVEFDFAAMNGAQLLLDVAQRYLKALDGIGLDMPIEERFLAGRSYEEGLARYFRTVKTKKTAPKAARELAAAFADAVSAAVPTSVTSAFRNFVTAVASRGVKVVIATRATPEAAAAAFEPLFVENVSLYREVSLFYGCPRWDSWRRACMANDIARANAVAITGSGHGVKSALLAGMASMAVVRDRVAHQDYTGAGVVANDLSAASAKRLLAYLRV
jgi:beta-phosphoglucomutase-like phosphatase (HAD superfamily)